MNELYNNFGIKWKRPLKWYDNLILLWTNLAICSLAVDMGSVPYWVIFLIVANFCASLCVCANMLPDLMDIEE